MLKSKGVPGYLIYKWGPVGEGRHKWQLSDAGCFRTPSGAARWISKQ